MAEQTPQAESAVTPQAEPAKKTKAAPAEELTALTFIGTPYSGTLMIGVESFEVVDGKVSVPVRLLAGARQAGFA